MGGRRPAAGQPADDAARRATCPTAGVGTGHPALTDPPVPAFLLDWARLAGPAKVVTEVRSRLERGRLEIQARLVVDLPPCERRQVGQLLDASWAPSAALAQLRALLEVDVAGDRMGQADAATLRIRADDDPAGWGIVATLRAAVPSARPWRMPTNTTAYEEELLELLLADLAPPRNEPDRPDVVTLARD